MDDQNQNTSPQQTPTQGQGGQRVIQPTPAVEETTQQPVPQPITTNQIPETNQSISPPVNNEQVIKQQSNNVDPPVIYGGEAPTGTSFTPIPTSDDGKSKRHWLRWSIIGLALVVVIAAGVLFGTNYNLRATVLDSKFRQYTLINNKGYEYSTLFYKGSSTKSYNYGSSTNNVLVSPPIDKGGLPLVLSLNGRTNDGNPAAQQALKNSNSCSSSIDNVEAFSVMIKSLGVNANFCTNPTQDGVGPVNFNSAFGNSSSIYAIIISPYNPGGQVNSSIIAATQATTPNVNDIKTIAASFKYLGKN